MQELIDFVAFYLRMAQAEPQDVTLTLPHDEYVMTRSVHGVEVERGPFAIGPKPAVPTPPQMRNVLKKASAK